MVEQTIVGLLNRHVDSQLRVQVDSVTHTASTGQANLTALVEAADARLRELEHDATAVLPETNRWEDGGLLVRWTARKRARGEEREPVAFSTTRSGD